MNIIRFIKVFRQMECPCAAPYIGKCCLRRLLHHLAKLPCEDELSLSAQNIDLRAQHISADLCPCKSCDNAHKRFPLLSRRTIFRLFEKVRKGFLVHPNGWMFPFDDASRRLATNLPKNTFQFTHTSFTRVGLDELCINFCADANILSLQPVAYTLSR